MFSSIANTTPLHVLSDELRPLLRSRNSRRQMSVMAVTVPPGGLVPPHRHAVEEEGYFMLEGALTLRIADETRVLIPGDFGYVAASTVHGYANQSNLPARFLAWTVGGPIDEFFEAMHQEVHAMPDDADKLMQITRRFGVEMLPPS